MILPHFDIIVQCLDVVKGLPVASWEEQSRPAKRFSGLVGRWAMEKAFTAAILARGAAFPKDHSLVSLSHASGVGLADAQRVLLAVIDKEVTANELEDTDDLALYLDCCLLARGITETVHQHLTLVSIIKRKPDKEKP